MNASLQFAGKAVFVAGGTSGINLGIAKAFAASGAQVGVISRSADKVAAAVTTLGVPGRPAWGVSADVRDAAALAKAVGDFAELCDKIDIVVSGAAGNFLAPAATLSPNGFKTVIDIDVLGTFNVMKAVYPHLRRPGASIVSISAPQSYVPIVHQVHACAAKAGVDQITRVLAKEWGPEGIRINSIAPGAIAGTEGLARLAPAASENRDPVLETVPLRRYGTVDDIATMALFLASDAASYVSGAVVPVDGGWGVTGPVSSR